ncbi:MAG: DotU family type VI secretion system protein [Acetobacteraceae bacterium]
MPSDPFAEPSDSEGTIFRPRPSGAAADPGPPGDAALRPGPARPVPKVGVNPLVAAASPVLAAAMRAVSGRGDPPDTDRLRAAMVRAIRGFETEALATGLDTRSLRAARYALCATVDDMVLSTPWGSASSWAQQTLTSVFHNEVIGGDRFFDILEQLQHDLGRHAPVVELMYLCTSLGFEGRYRVMPRGVAALTELRDGVYRTLRQRRGDWERELSPHWRGIAAGARSLAERIPLWAIGLATLAVALTAYVWLSFLLAGRSDAAVEGLGAIPPSEPMAVSRAAVRGPAPPPAAPAPASSFSTRLRQFLAPEIRAGLVQVFEDAQTVTVRLTNRNMFGLGEAALGGSYPPLLGRIGEALQDETGGVLVNGYTDNQKIRTPRFPSNFELSQARADAVAAVLRAKLSDPKRVQPKGRGEADPIAPNATPAGQQQNRRVEIVLVRASDQP